MIYFSNKLTDFDKNMDKLPLELIDIIYSFVPLEVKAFLTKNNYREYHGLLREKIGKKIENYIRHTIRQDNDFVFNRILYDNYSKLFFNLKFLC